MADPNGRTHEPTYRELVAELDGFKALMEERRHGTAAALQALEKQMAASFLASEKAVLKAEASQTQYNVGHNDLTRKMDAQYKDMLPRTEGDARFKAMEEKLSEHRKEIDRVRDESRLLVDNARAEIASLRESRSEGTGRRDQTAWIVNTVIALLSALGGVGVTLILRSH